MQLTKPGIYMGYIAGDETPPMRETPHFRNIDQSCSHIESLTPYGNTTEGPSAQLSTLKHPQ